MSFDDQAAADRLLKQIGDVMTMLTRWKTQMGESNDVLDDMSKQLLKFGVAIEVLNKKQSQAIDLIIFKQQAFYKQQNKLQQSLTHKSVLRSAEQDKQTREVQKRHAAYFAMQKEMVDYRHSFKDFDAGLSLLSSAMKGSGFGFAAGGTVEGIRAGAGIVQSTQKADDAQTKDIGATQAYDDFLTKNKAAMQAGGKAAKDLQEEMQDLLAARSKAGAAHVKAKSGMLYQLGQTGAGGDKTLADRLKGVGDFLTKHKLGVVLGLGTMVAFGAIIKKAMDSSPMMGQMLKLWKYAIMMIFRPLGDFFGFFFRPILVLLLRKFIIPWYTTMYPIMIKLGNDLGGLVAGFLDWITNVGAKIIGFFTGLGTGTFDINGLVAMLIGGTKTIGTSFIDILVGKLIPSAFAATGNTILSDSWDLFYKGISTILDTMKPFVVTAITWVGNVAKWLVGEGSNVVKFAWETLKEQMPFIKSIFTWLKEQMPNVKTLFETFMTSLEWLKTKWTEVSTALTNAQIMLEAGVNILMMLPANIYTGLLNLPQQIGDGIMSIFTGIFNYLETLPLIGGTFKELRKHTPFAEGGRITEPIFGVGKSGQTYSFGEKGSETVIPDGKGGFGGGITINIQNMSGSQSDLNNLRQTILSVVQEANTRRGRI